MKRIVVLGPGPGFKGGIANFSISLSKAFAALSDTEIHLVSWSNQYPFFVPRDFTDDKSQTELLEKSGVTVHYTLNYNRPWTWRQTYKTIVELNPDMVIVQWSNPVQAFPLAYVIRQLKEKTSIRVFADIHFGSRKGHSDLVKKLTVYAIRYADAFVVHSYKTAFELKELLPDQTFNLMETPDAANDKGKPILKLYHPIYDMFTRDPTFDREAVKKKLHLRKFVFLFFGFIIKYKGLHNAIAAFAKLASTRDDVSLLIVGESTWQASRQRRTRIRRYLSRQIRRIVMSPLEDEGNYQPLQMIDELGVSDRVTVVNEFVPNEEVHRYFQVSDAVVLFYDEPATASGVESIAYNLDVPIVATRLGHFAETVKDGVTGYLATPKHLKSMVEAMQNIIEQPIPPEELEKVVSERNWANYAKSISTLVENMQ